MTNAVIVLNAGSTSVKFGAYGIDDAEPRLLCRGQIESMQGNPRFTVCDAGDKPLDAHEWGTGNAIDRKSAMRFVFTWLESRSTGARLVAAGHRVVLGGARFAAPVLIEQDVLDYLDSLTTMEPSHQPYNLLGARALAEAFPGLPQVACFDSSFHRTMPRVAQIYALPADVHDAGACHWGYHGISYDYISRELPKYAPRARRVIAAHLGGGASMCAMLDGRSVETTMGFAGVSGLPMGTRSGDVPIDVLFYLLRQKKFDDASLEKMLYERSGLLGLSGVSGDMRELEQSSDPRAAAAIDYFVYAITKFAGAYAAVLGGLDAFVFTAGIGEHSARVRAALCRNLAWLGVRLDDQANAAHGPRISTSESAASVWVIPTNEELMIAQHTLALAARRFPEESCGRMTAGNAPQSGIRKIPRETLNVHPSA
jgi:acetate kinase